jgi:hypothetical protein
MQRFLSFSYLKGQWMKWRRPLTLLPRYQQKKEHHREQELVEAIRPGSTAVNCVVQYPQYEIRFQSLYNAGRALTFPCDAQGHVEMDALSERARLNYLYARAVVGREFAAPAVREAELH